MASLKNRVGNLEKERKGLLTACACSVSICVAFFLGFLFIKCNFPSDISLFVASLVVGFIGALATLVVVRNESQVREVKNEFERKVVEVEKASRKYTKDRIADYELSVDAVMHQIVGMIHESEMRREEALEEYMLALESVSKATDKTPLNGIMSYAIRLVEKNLIRVSEEDKRRYLSIIRKIDHADVSRLEDLIRTIGCPRPSE